MLFPTLTPAERAAIQPRERLTIAQWSARHMRITEGPEAAEDGTEAPLYNPDLFPLQRTITEAIDDRRWSRIFMMTAPQAFGKTQCAALPTALHALHHRRVSAAYVTSAKHLASTQWARKFKPAIEADKDLAPLIPENTDAGGRHERRDFTNGTSLHFAGADSAGSLSGFTCPVIICDDIQAYPATLPGFGHPADLAWKRAGSFATEQVTLVGIGTAGTVSDYLWQQMLASALFCPFIPCPGCGTYQMIEFDRLVYDETSVVHARAETYLACARPNCEYRMRFDQLPAMLADHLWISCPPDSDWTTKPPPGGVWIQDLATASIYPETARNTNVAGFWANALYWPLGRTWGEHAADYITLRGNPDRLKDHQQHVRVVPYEPPEEDDAALTVTDLVEHASTGYGRGTVPEAANVVTLTSDVHDRFLYYIARAWNRDDGTSWLVDAGTLGVHGPRRGEELSDGEREAKLDHAIRLALEDLWLMAVAGWPVMAPDGSEVRQIRPEIAIIDGGYRPSAVGVFCRMRNAGQPRRQWYMIRGKSEAKGAKAIWPRREQRNKYGHPYREINVDEGKHLLREILSIPASVPGAWHTYADADLSAYHRHLVSEHFVEQKSRQGVVKRWAKREGGGPNHWLDCEVYQIAAAMAVGVMLPTHAAQAVASASATTISAAEWFRSGKKRR